jgi:hypothetical protein
VNPASDLARISVKRTEDNVDVHSRPPFRAREDLSDLASDDSESRSKIEAPTGVGNEREQ